MGVDTGRGDQRALMVLRNLARRFRLLLAEAQSRGGSSRDDIPALCFIGHFHTPPTEHLRIKSARGWRCGLAHGGEGGVCCPLTARCSKLFSKWQARPVRHVPLFT